MGEAKLYIGAKIVKACPATKADVNAELGRVSDNLDFFANGYRVQYPDGYVSWSPRATFEEAYRLVSDDEKAMF